MSTLNTVPYKKSAGVRTFPKPYIHVIKEKIVGLFRSDETKIRGAFGRQDGLPANPPTVKPVKVPAKPTPNVAT